METVWLFIIQFCILFYLFVLQLFHICLVSSIGLKVHLIVVQFLSHVWLFATPWTAAHQASLSFTISLSLLRHMSIELVMPSNHPLSAPSPPTFNLSQHQDLFQWISSLHQVVKVLVLQLQHQSFQYSGMISFRIDWFDCLAVQGTLKSLLQHHSSKASILWWSAFFMVQLSHPYMITRNTVAFTIWTFVGKVMSLLFFPPNSRLNKDLFILRGKKKGPKHQAVHKNNPQYQL